MSIYALWCAYLTYYQDQHSISDGQSTKSGRPLCSAKRPFQNAFATAGERKMQSTPKLSAYYQFLCKYFSGKYNLYIGYTSHCLNYYYQFHNSPFGSYALLVTANTVHTCFFRCFNIIVGNNNHFV